MADYPKLEVSLFGGVHTSVHVHIYPLARDQHWTLEVVDDDRDSLIWPETFASYQDAFRVFYDALETESILSMLSDLPRQDPYRWEATTP